LSTINKAGKKFILGVCKVFLFLAHAVNRGLPPALSLLASQLSNLKEKTIELCKQFVDCMAIQEDTIVTYHASNMILAIHRYGLYLSEPKVCSQV
jgi:hypothetical protein